VSRGLPIAGLVAAALVGAAGARTSAADDPKPRSRYDWFVVPFYEMVHWHGSVPTAGFGNDPIREASGELSDALSHGLYLTFGQAF
jgi:hypothetical protein